MLSIYSFFLFLTHAFSLSLSVPFCRAFHTKRVHTCARARSFTHTCKRTHTLILSPALPSFSTPSPLLYILPDHTLNFLQFQIFFFLSPFFFLKDLFVCMSTRDSLFPFLFLFFVLVNFLVLLQLFFFLIRLFFVTFFLFL